MNLPIYQCEFKYTNRKKTNIYYNVEIILLTFFMIFTYVISLFFSNMKILVIFSLVLLISGIILIKKKTNTFLSFSNIFYVVCFLFHCSYFILIVTNNIRGNVNYFLQLSVETQIKTLKYCLIFLLVFPLGHIFYKGKFKQTNKIYLKNNQLFKIGVFLMAICLIPRLYVDFKTIQLYLEGGYLYTFNATFNNYITIIANLFYFAVLLSLIGCKDNEKLGKLILLISIIIVLLGMLSGRRDIKAVYLITILFVYFKTQKEKINVPKVLVLLFLCYVFLVFIATIGDIRTSGNLLFNDLINLFIKNFTIELFADQLSEFGYAASTLGASIEYFPSSTYGYGINYIASWLEIFPNLGGFLTGFSDKMNYVLKFPPIYHNSLGGSVLGEFFYNFGYLSFIPIFLLGMFFCNVSNILEKQFKKGCLTLSGLICLLLISPSLLWIRSVFNEFPRTIVWNLLIIFVLKGTIYYNKKYKL